jgi:hypothetical protein
VAKKLFSASAQFGGQIKKYLKCFNLYPEDIAYALKTNTESIALIINGNKRVYLETIEKIADLFGLAYYEMGNPDYPIPSEKDLPENTKLIIKKREIDGEPKKYGDHDINQSLDDIFRGSFLEIPRTTTEIAKELPHSIPSTVRTASRVSDAIKKGTWDGLIAKLPKPDGERQRYQLVKFIGKYA